MGSFYEVVLGATSSQDPHNKVLVTVLQLHIPEQGNVRGKGKGACVSIALIPHTIYRQGY